MGSGDSTEFFKQQFKDFRLQKSERDFTDFQLTLQNFELMQVC